MSIREWPKNERPREKLLKFGASHLSDAELLAVFLGGGLRGGSAVDLARQLITQFGGLRPLLDANNRVLLNTNGIGPARLARLRAAIELGTRHLQSTLQREGALSNPEDTKRFLSARMRHHNSEVFACLFLDTRNRVLAFHELFYGTINSTSVHPRDIVRKALEYNAAAVIATHNHPSGVTEPSRSDHALTQRLRKALELIDVRLIDHIIVGDGETISFSESGWL